MKMNRKEISRVLKPEAHLVWTDFTLPKTIKLLCRFFVKNYGLYTLPELTATFDAFGFREHYREKIPHGLVLILKKRNHSPQKQYPKTVL